MNSLKTSDGEHIASSHPAHSLKFVQVGTDGRVGGDNEGTVHGDKENANGHGQNL